MTKPMTAVAALALVREGRLRLDEPVDRLLPELAERRVLRRMDGPLDETVPADRPIIVRELLNFTFGFGATREMFAASEPWPVVLAANDLHLSTVGPPNPDEQPDPDTWMAGLGSLPLLAQPGERWLYSTGASVLGVLVAAPRASRSPTFSGRGSSNHWASATRRSGPRTPIGSRPRTARVPTASSSGTNQAGPGAIRRPSVTGRRGSCPRRTTSGRSPACCCVAAARFSREKPSRR